jgi:hypothetical protein
MTAPQNMRVSVYAIAVTGLVVLASGTSPSARAGQGADSRSASGQSVPQRAELESVLRDAAKTLRDAVGDEAQKAAKAHLLAVISNYFDADLDDRRRQLAAIETRLTKLKGELDQRLAAKNEIIHLQLKALEKDDSGLGVYSREEMSKLLANYFDADMKNRQGGLADMAARVNRLHAQLDKRQAARDEIIQLQLNVLVVEAAGMGFYSQPKSDGA